MSWKAPNPGMNPAVRSWLALFALVALAPCLAVAQKVYFVELDAQQVRSADRDGSDLENLGATSAPLGIAVDSGAGKLYWIVRSVYGGPVDGIVRSNLDGSGLETLVTGLGQPAGLALDLVHGTMYWTDHHHDVGYPRIQRADLDGGNLTTLVSTGLNDPAGIALDVAAGTMYWVDHHNDTVMRANVDGSAVETLVGGGAAYRPVGISLDLARGKLYWTETNGHRIRRADLDGGNVEVVMESAALGDLVDLKVDVVPGLLFFTDYSRNLIRRSGLAGEGLTTIVSSLGGPWGLALDRAPCSTTLDVPNSRWTQVALPCDPGATSRSAEVFADLEGRQNIEWALLEWDTEQGVYVRLFPNDAVEQGRGYWLKTLLPDQSVTFTGLEADTSQRFAVALESAVDGRWNMVGNPFGFDVSWSDVRFLHDGQVKTLDEVDPMVGAVRACSTTPPDPSCVVSREAYSWNGSAYQSFNGLSPGASGTLGPAGGFWVLAFQPASLLVPALPASTLAAEKRCEEVASEGWWVRLVVSSGGLTDPGNVLGQLPGAVRGFDPYDLTELEPNGDDYLTIVFPHPHWTEQAGDYTADFHSVPPDGRADRWRFEVRSGAAGRTVTLRWEGSREVLERCRLVDHGEPDLVEPARASVTLPVEPDDSYSFVLTGQRRVLTWVVAGQ